MINDLSPSHVAIIMDGNGRWASLRHLPRYRGHSEGGKAVEHAINAAAKNKIPYLTLFAFSSENILRPAAEISFLKKLFYKNISERLEELHKNNIKLKFIGDLNYFGETLNNKMKDAVLLTQNNTGLVLTIALNYGGRWDITQACSKIIKKIAAQNLKQSEIHITEQDIKNNLETHDLPDPDLFIRTSGEQRVSNFLLWQLAYTELYFSSKFWPDFTEEDFNLALRYYSTRNRRFGLAPVVSDTSC